MSAPNKSSLKIAGPLESKDFELNGDRLVAHSHPAKTIPLADIADWRQEFLCLGVWNIRVRTTDGTVFEWNDGFGHLMAILKQALAEKELPYLCR